jgi:hypothetical protein
LNFVDGAPSEKSISASWINNPGWARLAKNYQPETQLKQFDRNIGQGEQIGQAEESKQKSFGWQCSSNLDINRRPKIRSLAMR